MITIHATNVNDAWPQAVDLMYNESVLRASRNGGVLEVPSPVTTVYRKPVERVLFDPVRDANPFFHFHEGLWMLAGRNDVKWITWFLPRMVDFSNDGAVLGGAYGYRWRNWFEDSATGQTDQLIKIIHMLRSNHEDRRVVLAMWDPTCDLNNPGAKDIPCNTHIYFYIRPVMDNWADKLDMTVCCRSNDICLGAYGANVAHMSMLHECIAAMVGVPMGSYRQISHSFHAYTENWSKFTGLPVQRKAGVVISREPGSFFDPYQRYNMEPYPMVQKPECWFEELESFMAYTSESMEQHGSELPRMFFINSFFSEVAMPIFFAFCAWKANEPDTASEHLRHCRAVDWRIACEQWMGRRLAARQAKAGAGQ